MPGPSPSPSPQPSPSPSSRPSSVPSVPDYSGAAGTSTTTSSGGGSSDIWGLGQAYGKPVYLGQAGNGSYTGGNGDPSLKVGRQSAGQTHPAYGQTQDIIQQIVDLWAAQQSERKKNPRALTQYEQLQQALYAGGFYGQTSFDKIHVGQWTAQTKDAVTAALNAYEQATNKGQQPVTFTEFLQNNATMGQDGGIGASQGRQQQITLADPAQIRDAAQNAAVAALGQGLTADQLSAFVTQFQNQQIQNQTDAYTQQTKLPAEAMAYAQQQDPQAYQDNKRQAYLDSLVNLLGGSKTSRPNMTPVPAAGGSQ